MFAPCCPAHAFQKRRRTAGQWCSTAPDGINYNDITPRWGVAWDVFGTGKTSIDQHSALQCRALGRQPEKLDLHSAAEMARYAVRRGVIK